MIVPFFSVGESTANDLHAHGVIPDLVPERFLSAALLPLLEQDQRGIASEYGLVHLLKPASWTGELAGHSRAYGIARLRVAAGEFLHGFCDPGSAPASL